MAAIFALGAAAMASSLFTLGLSVVLGLAGVVLLRGNRWRSGALLLGAIAASWALLDVMADWLSPVAMGKGLSQTTVPRVWMPPDPVLGYRPRPDSTVRAIAAFDGQPVYDVTYTIDASGARAMSPAPPGADTYIFMGDSFMFGQGLADGQTLPAQFAQAYDSKVRTVNISAPGYGPNHLVRAFEAGLLDRFKDQPVKAVVTWIIPSHLARVTGDGGWLGSSPRYVLENGVPRHTGSFTAHRWQNPLSGLAYIAGEHFSFIRAIGARQREQEQGDIFVALVAQLRRLALERFGAPLVVIYSWPEENVSPADMQSLRSLLDRLRKTGASLFSVDRLTAGRDMSLILIPHDGHPTAFTNQLIANDLKVFLNRP